MAPLKSLPTRGPIWNAGFSDVNTCPAGWNRPTHFVSHRLLHGSSFQDYWAGLDSNWQAILLYNGFPFHLWRKNYLKWFCLNQSSLLPPPSSPPYFRVVRDIWHDTWGTCNLENSSIFISEGHPYISTQPRKDLQQEDQVTWPGTLHILRMTAPRLAQPVEKQTPPKWFWGHRHGQGRRVFLGEESITVIRPSAFPHASWHLHNCSDSQFYLYSWKEANVHTLGELGHQLACCLLTAILHVLYTQSSVEQALKPCPLHLCGPSLSLSPSPFTMDVPHHRIIESYLQCQVPGSSSPLWTSSRLLLLQAAVPKPSLPLWLHIEVLGEHGILKAQESLSSPGNLKMLACCILLLNM